MAFDSVPWIIDGTTIDAEVIRRALGTLISPAGGIVSTGDLQVTQLGTPAMNVQVGAGEIWVPGSSSATQGPYYSRNGAAVTLAIAAANASNPRIDTVIVQVQDPEYTGVTRSMAAAVITGTPTAGATLVNLNGAGVVPASSLVIAYVLVPANATSITTADISNVATLAGTRAQGGATNIVGPESRTNTAYGTMPTPDQVTGIVLPTNGLIRVWYQALWQESVAEAAAATIFIGANQLRAQVVKSGGFAPSVATVAAQTNNAAAAINTALTTSPLGLVSGFTSPSGGSTGADVTTGQVVGYLAAGSGGGASYRLDDTNLNVPQGVPLGGPCDIFAAAGTYTVSVQFKASSGSVTASNRKLWVQAVPFA